MFLSFILIICSQVFAKFIFLFRFLPLLLSLARFQTFVLFYLHKNYIFSNPPNAFKWNNILCIISQKSADSTWPRHDQCLHTSRTGIDQQIRNKPKSLTVTHVNDLPFLQPAKTYQFLFHTTPSIGLLTILYEHLPLLSSYFASCTVHFCQLMIAFSIKKYYNFYIFFIVVVCVIRFFVRRQFKF